MRTTGMTTGVRWSHTTADAAVDALARRFEDAGAVMVMVLDTEHTVAAADTERQEIQGALPVYRSVTDHRG